jgi:hypothetical protein
MTPFGQPWSTLGQTLLKTPFGCVLQISHKHFKFSQYKSCVFVEGHNFHVDWHWRFGVEEGQKCKSTLLGTIHGRPEIIELGMLFVHKRWRMQDLQLWYSNVGPLQFKFLEKTPGQSR